MKRQISLLLTVLLLLPLFHAEAAKKKADPIVYPAADFRYENGTVIEKGARAIQDWEIAAWCSEKIDGWLFGDKLNYSFPVMAGTPKNDYAKKTYARSGSSKYGCVYLPCGASDDFSEKNLLLLGTTAAEAPLGAAEPLLKQGGYEAAPYLRLLTPNGDWQLDIFAAWKTTALTAGQLLPPEDESAFPEWLGSILSSSQIVPLDNTLPAPGERIAILENKEAGRRRVILAVVRPIRYETDNIYDLAKYEMDLREPTTHTVDAGPLGIKTVYWQKDPVWGKLRFESDLTSKYRFMEGGSCGPCAIANILVNIMTPEELMKIGDASATGYGPLFCTCSVNRVYCNCRHLPYRLSTAEEYVRYLPVVICNYAAGNNVDGVRSRWPAGVGTNDIYIPYLCASLGLTCESVSSLREGIEKVAASEGRGGLICCALDSSPFSVPSNYHYVSIIGEADGWFYVLDSLQKKSYDGKGHLAEKLAVGLIRFPSDYLTYASLSPRFYIENPAK